MRIHNVHERRLGSPPRVVGSFLDRLGSDPDPLWPGDRWPPLRLDRPLAEGAAGGHGPIRYTVDLYRPGERVRFRFTGPPGLNGFHEFVVIPDSAGTLLSHVLDGRARGAMVIRWLLVLRPLHDALIEDAFDRAERSAAGEVARPVRWPPWVRLLRRLLGRRRNG